MTRPDPDEEGLCPACSGSGEGQFEGTRCATCGGSGDDLHPWGRPHERDDFDDDIQDRSHRLMNTALNLLAALALALLLGASHYLDGADSEGLRATARCEHPCH
jgi:hypothetical protein